MNNETTQDEIRDFLKGRLSEAAAAAFRQRMANDPALEDRVAFARMLLGGLEALERKKRSRRNWFIGGGILLVVSAGLAIAWFLLQDHSPTPPPAPPPPRPATGSNPGQAATQAGSNSEKFESDRAISLCWNSRGEVIVGGQFEGAPVFGDIRLPGFGGRDIFITACNQNLEFAWARQFGSPLGNDYLCEICLDSKDNILVTGGFFDQARFDNRIVRAKGKANLGEGDFFIAKLNPKGKLLWLDHSGGNMIPDKQTGNNLGHTVVADHADNIIAAGAYIGTPKIGAYTLPVGGPNEDLYLVKYTPDGQITWLKTITSDFQMVVRSLATDDQNNLYLTGQFGHHNFGGKAYFDKDTLQSFGGQDIFLAKYNPDGQLQWVRQAGSTLKNGHESGTSVLVDHQGQVLLTGYFEDQARFENQIRSSRGKHDVFVAKYNAAGKLLWVNTYGGQQRDVSGGLSVDQTGNVYCVGQFTGQAVFDQLNRNSKGAVDMFVLKLNPDGQLQWVQQAGGDTNAWNSDAALSIAIDKSNRLVITGFFSGTMQLGNQMLRSAGREDMFLLFFDANGRLLDARRTNYAL
ncbi:MAG: hypothetical protein H6569_05020 [Lewinellaceae bacterium]|nr:hypothetical protein [Lewinellaceae bacterium]